MILSMQAPHSTPKQRASSNSLSPCQSYSLSRIPSLSHTHTHTLSLSHKHTHSLSVPPSHSLSLRQSLFLIHTLTLNLSISLTHSVSLSHTHTHTHTHSPLSLSSETPTFSCSYRCFCDREGNTNHRSCVTFARLGLQRKKMLQPQSGKGKNFFLATFMKNIYLSQ